VLRLAVEWGAIPFNPAREVKKYGKADGAGPRDRYATEAEFAAVYEFARPALRVAMNIALLTGLRRENLVTLTRHNITDDGLAVVANKGGKRLLFTWTPELRAAVDAGLALWPKKYPCRSISRSFLPRDAEPLRATVCGKRSLRRVTLRLKLGSS